MKSLLIAAVALASATMRADVIFSTLDGPQVAGYQVSGASSGFGPESVAASFESGSPFSLTGAGVQILAIQGATFNMALFASDVNGLPGVELASIGTNLTAPLTSGIVSATLPVALTVAAQTEYWLVLTPAAGDSQVSWGVVSGAAESPLSTTIQTDGSGGWNFIGHEPLEFEIDGVPETSEPASALLLIIALVAIFVYHASPTSTQAAQFCGSAKLLFERTCAWAWRRASDFDIAGVFHKAL